MSDAPKYEIKTSTNGTTYLMLPITIYPKGKKTITLDMDDYEMDETGTKVKNNRPVAYYTFKLIESK